MPAAFRIYHDSFILKFTPDGKYLGQIGKANGSKGSLDTDNVRGVAQIRFLPKATRWCWRTVMATSAFRCGTPPP